MGIAGLEFEVALHFAQRQQRGEQEEDHPAEHRDNGAVGHLPTGTRGVPQEDKHRVGAESVVADHVGEQAKQGKQADHQPGLLALELAQAAADFFNGAISFANAAFQRVVCAKFFKYIVLRGRLTWQTKKKTNR